MPRPVTTTRRLLMCLFAFAIVHDRENQEAAVLAALFNSINKSCAP